MAPISQPTAANKAVAAMLAVARAGATTGEVAAAAVVVLSPAEAQAALEYGLGGTIGLAHDEGVRIRLGGNERLVAGSVALRAHVAPVPLLDARRLRASGRAARNACGLYGSRPVAAPNVRGRTRRTVLGLDSRRARASSVQHQGYGARGGDARRRACVFDTLGASPVSSDARGRAARLRQASGERVALGFADCRLYVGATRATEVDDIDVASCTTVGSVVVPAALAMAVRRRADGRALLAAVVTGYEAMQRLGRAIGGATLIYRGVWPTYVTAPLAAAATVAKLLRLDAPTTERALALALTRTTAAPAAALTRFGFRYDALGCAAVEGADAAFLAAQGIEADGDALTSFAERIAVTFDAAELVRPADTSWLLREVDSKLWPTSRQALAGVAAFRELKLTPQSVDAIERIVVAVPGAYRAMVDRAAPPAQRIESMIGVQYQFALATFAAETLYDAIRTEVPTPPEYAALMAKIEVRADEALDARFPRQWGGRVTVRFRSGEERTHEVLDPDGGAARPLDLDGLERKYARLFAASKVGKPNWLSVARERCQRLGRATGDAGLVTDLWTSIE
jgi:2-methylcitrate dehydratase PrpD